MTKQIAIRKRIQFYLTTSESSASVRVCENARAFKKLVGNAFRRTMVNENKTAQAVIYGGSLTVIKTIECFFMNLRKRNQIVLS